MKLANGELLTLNGINYRIEESLGHGAVSDAYRAWLGDIPDQIVVIKLVQDEEAGDPIKVTALQREAEVLRTLNAAEDEGWDRLPDAMTRLRRARETESWRKIIALLDAGEITHEQPFVIQEFAPPAFERFDIATLADEYRMLTIAKGIAEALKLTHRHNLAFKDFAPDTKGDRIRLRWLDNQQENPALKIIDWNVTGGPEDMRQDLFFFGGHLHYLFTGRNVPLDKESHPPVNLGAGDLAWAALTDGTRRLISKALHRDTKRRYQQSDVLLDDLDWWHETLALSKHVDALRKLETRLWDADDSGRFDRVFAAADLALRLQLPLEARLSFEQALERAKQKLGQEIWQPIADARVSLGMRAYEKAIDQFAQQLKTQPPESEVWRLAYIYQRLARIGNELRRYYQNVDERHTPEWEALDTRAILALVERRWRDAQMAFAEASRLRPECRSWDSFNELEHWARAGVTYITVVNQAFLAAENRADPRSPEWLMAEKLSKEAHQKALEILTEVRKEAPFETEFKERWTFESLSYERRNTFFDFYEKADSSFSDGQKTLDSARNASRDRDFIKAIEEYQLAQGQLADAYEQFQEILAQDPGQGRARFFLRRAELLRNEAEASETLGQARKMLDSGYYDKALDLTKRVLESAPGREDAQLLQTDAEMGNRLLERVRDYLRLAEDNLETDDCDGAEKALNSFQDWDHRTLQHLIGDGTAADQIGGRLFRLSPEIQTRVTDLRVRIPIIRETQSNLSAAEKKYDYAEIVRLCETLKERQRPLSSEMQRQLESAREKLKNHSDVEALLLSLPSRNVEEDFVRLRAAVDLLRNDKGPKALELIQQLAEQWAQLTQEFAPANLEQLLNRATEGRRRFPGQTEQRFSNMEDQAQRAKDVAQLLAKPDEDSRYPIWFTWPDWGTKLSNADENLVHLEGPQSWVELREGASTWRAQVKQYVETFMRVQLASSEKQARERYFDASLANLTLLQQNLRRTLYDSLPQDLQNNLTSLQDALNVRLTADGGFKGTFERFDVAQMSAEPGAEAGGRTSAGFTFQEALQALRSIILPDHAAVPIDDLKTQLAEVETFAAAEQALRVNPVSDLTPTQGQSNYAQVIYDCRSALELQANALNAYDGINQRVSDLKRKLGDKINKTGEALTTTLQGAVEAQKRDPKLNPQRVVALYTQALWWQPMSFVNLNPVIEDARKLPYHILKEAGQALTALRDLESPEQKSEIATAAPEKGAVLYLQHTQTLNNELLYPPTNKLPPLPANVQLREIPLGWELPGDSVEALKTLAIQLRSLLQQTAQLQPQTLSEVIETPNAEAPGSDSSASVMKAVTETPVEVNTSVPVSANGTSHYDGAQVELAHRTALELQKIIKDLGVLWPALRLTWATDSNLVQLGSVASKIVDITEYLGAAYKELVERKALQGLNILYEKLEQPKIIEKLEKHSLIQEFENHKQFWLTKPLQALKVNFIALRQETITALGNQIADILAMPNAAEQLEREILTQVKARWVAEAVYQALNQGVDARAKQAEIGERKDAAQRLWKIVMEATKHYYQQRQSGAAPSAKQSSGGLLGSLLGLLKSKGNSSAAILKANSTSKPASAKKWSSRQQPTAQESQLPVHPPLRQSDK